MLLYHPDGWWDDTLSELMVRSSALPGLMRHDDVSSSDSPLPGGCPPLVEGLPCLLFQKGERHRSGGCSRARQAANYCLSHLTQLLLCTHKPRQMSHPIFTTPTSPSRQSRAMRVPGPAGGVCVTPSHSTLTWLSLTRNQKQ